MTTFTFFSDPGHGWLLVEHDIFHSTGLTSAYITPCSFKSSEGIIALEEDCDAPYFLDVWTYRFGKPAIKDTHGEQTPIRSWPRFGELTDDGPHTDHVAGLVLEIAAEKMEIERHRVASLMEMTNWGSIRAMIRREFTGPYKGYYPSCGMSLASEAVIAECFDAIALLMKDKRRARRWPTH